jgi:hypothetical protein
VDGWRAHLNTLTWPEVARQLAIAAGLGRRRPRPRRDEKAKLGQEGEDTVQDESGACLSGKESGGSKADCVSYLQCSLLCLGASWARVL